MRLAYQYRLRPTSQQIATFESWLELCRRQYNYFKNIGRQVAQLLMWR